MSHHADCGMLTFADDGFRQDIERETGVKPGWAAEAFPDLDADVRQSRNLIVADPSILVSHNRTGVGSLWIE